ncbi:MAG: hypothetical protein H7831_06895 [Magnetococcus sp. WYHC-3]
MTARIAYMTTGTPINIDVSVLYPGPDIEFVQQKNVNKAGSGKTETINLYGTNRITVDIQFSSTVYYDMAAWWAWARQGKHFAFYLNSAKGRDTKLDTSATVGDTVIKLTATSDFAIGDTCLIRAQDNDDEFEVVRLTSIKASTSVKISKAIVYSYNSSDVFRHLHCFPKVIATNDSFKPNRIGAGSTSANPYYRLSLSMEEDL